MSVSIGALVLVLGAVGENSIAVGDADSGIGFANWSSSGNGWRGDINRKDGQMLLRAQLQLLF